MSSGFQHSDAQSTKLYAVNSAHYLEVESTPSHTKHGQAAARITEMDNASPRLRFNGLTLDELSEELDRRTKETQKLQDEVEKATKLTMERFDCAFISNSTAGQGCHKSRIIYDPPTTHQQASTLVSELDSLNQGLVESGAISPGEELFKNVIDECQQWHQRPALQLNKARDQPEQETFRWEKAIMNLQTELHKVQMEKDSLSDLRLKDSIEHVGQMEKMLHMLEELQTIERAEDRKLPETEDRGLMLNRRVEKLEQKGKEMFFSPLVQERQCGDKCSQSLHINTTGSRPLTLTAKLTEESKDETDRLQDKLLLSVEHLGNEECSAINTQTESLCSRMDAVIGSLVQEMALLTEKLSSSKDDSVSLSGKLKLLKKLAERQTSLHQTQVCELVSTLSRHSDKICCLERNLIQAQSQLLDAQQQKEQSVRQAEELQSQLDQLKRCSKQQKCELQEEVRVLRGQLEAAREQLCREEEEKSSLQTQLEQRACEGRKSQECLEEKNKEVRLMWQETQRHLARMDEAQRQYQTLQADRETLRLKLDDQEKMMDILRSQMESSLQMTVQHSRTIDSLHQQNRLLSEQLNQHKLEIQQLMTESDRHKSDLAAAEQEKQWLQASVAEHSQRFQEERLEKQQLTTQLELQHTKLLSLKKEHEQLQQLRSGQKEEHEGVVLKLQSQLRSAHYELDRVRGTLRTLEGADGHGLQAAMDMQEKITARREQIDTLQCKIQHLKESMEKLYQEKHRQSLEHQRRLQELTFVREEKKQLGDELEALRSKDRVLRDRIGHLEAILHKMSESFTDCQEFIQLQEQQFYRLKLQHALDLKELQGQTLHTTLSGPPPYLGPPSRLTDPPSSQCASNTQATIKRQMDNPTRELRSLVEELQAVISLNHRPQTDNSAIGSSFHRRRSAPDRLHKTSFRPDEAEEGKAGSRFRRKTCGSKPHVPRTAELNERTIVNKSFSDGPLILNQATTAKYTSSPRLSLGRRSPVYCLLTSDPNSHQ